MPCGLLQLSHLIYTSPFRNALVSAYIGPVVFTSVCSYVDYFCSPDFVVLDLAHESYVASLWPTISPGSLYPNLSAPCLKPVHRHCCLNPFGVSKFMLMVVGEINMTLVTSQRLKISHVFKSQSSLSNSNKQHTVPLSQELIFRMNLSSSVKLLTCSLFVSSVW